MTRSAPVICALLTSALLAAVHHPASAQSPSPLDVDLGHGTNEAFISQQGQGQRATIEQRNIEGGLLSGAIRQNGSGNQADLLLEGGDLAGSIDQVGSDNAASLEVRGHGNRGAVVQSGDGNAGGLVVKGQGQDVTLFQEGGVKTQGAPISINSDTPTGQPIIVRQY
jgi:hypothetical protein